MHITDVNDNTPTFTEPLGYSFAVNEGQAGLTVGVVTVKLFSLKACVAGVIHQTRSLISRVPLGLLSREKNGEESTRDFPSGLLAAAATP